MAPRRPPSCGRGRREAGRAGTRGRWVDRRRDAPVGPGGAGGGGRGGGAGARGGLRAVPAAGARRAARGRRGGQAARAAQGAGRGGRGERPAPRPRPRPRPRPAPRLRPRPQPAPRPGPREGARGGARGRDARAARAEDPARPQVGLTPRPPVGSWRGHGPAAEEELTPRRLGNTIVFPDFVLLLLFLFVDLPPQYNAVPLGRGLVTFLCTCSGVDS